MHDGMLLRSAVSRCSLLDDAAFFVPQCWKHSTGMVWWDLNYAFAYLKRKGAIEMKRRQWLQWVSRKIAEAWPNEAKQVHLTEHATGLSEAVLKANICTTLGLYTFVCLGVDICNIKVEAALWPVLKAVCERVCSIIAPTASSELTVGDCTPRVRHDGQVQGFPEFLGGASKLSYSMYKEVWGALCLSGRVVSAFEAGSHSLADVIAFVCTFAKVRRQARRPPSPRAERLLALFREVFLKWLADRVDEYVNHYCSSNSAAADRPPPALTLRRGEAGERPYTKVSPEAAWNVIVMAREARTSLSQALVLRKDDAALGCSGCTGDLWVNKYLQMYYQRCRFYFNSMAHEVNH